LSSELERLAEEVSAARERLRELIRQVNELRTRLEAASPTDDVVPGEPSSAWKLQSAS
jgi:hypothetical protein